MVEGLPDLQKEQTAARQKQQEERQMEMRRMRPPLNELLDPQQIQVALRGTPAQRAALFATLDPDKLQKIAVVLPPDALASQPELRRMGAMSRSPQQVVIADLREAKLYRALDSNRPLEEVLADFWFNHFNIFEGKDRVRAMLASYERDAIRPHVLGKFKDLLLATARHPAMLYYLDNWQSMSPDVFQIGPFAPRAVRSGTAVGAPGARTERELRTRAAGTAHAGSQRRIYAAGRDRGGTLLYGMDDSPAKPEARIHLRRVHARYRRKRRCSAT